MEKAITVARCLRPGDRFMLGEQICKVTNNAGLNALNQVVIRFEVDADVAQAEGSIIFPYDMGVRVFTED